MNLQQAKQSGKRIVQQRNLFLLLTILLAIISAALSLRMVNMEERIIMVPPLTSEVMISNRKVSSSYLEQMSMVFLNNLLDLSASDILHKRDVIIKYISNSQEGFAKQINEYFADAETKYKKFDLVTYFTAKNMEINEHENQVIIHGTLTSRYGKHGFESIPTSYRLSFEYAGGCLRLKEFNQIIKDDEKNAKSEKADNLKQGIK